MKLVPQKNGSLWQRRGVDSLFDDFFGTNWPLTQSTLTAKPETFIPQIGFSETEKQYRLTAELPGLEEKDFEVFVEDGILTLKGVKHQEKHEENENFHHYETSFGSFHRSFRLPEGIDTDTIDAKFKNGVLTLTIQKLKESNQRKKIQIKH